MKRSKFTLIILWLARVWGTLIITIVSISIYRDFMKPNEHLQHDRKGHVLSFGLLIGLLLAFRKELWGGIIATLAIVISGFWHPLVIPPGLLYILYWFLNRRERLEV